MTKSVTKNKQINFVHNADSRNLLSYIKPNTRIMTTITSPPYFDMKDYGAENQIGYGQKYEDYLNDLKLIFENIFNITEDQGSLWIVIDTFKRDSQVVTLPFDLSNKLKEIGWLLQDIIIWKKDKTVPWSTKGFVQRKFEYILFFSKSNSFKYNKDKVRNFDTSKLKRWWIKYPERYNPKGKALDEIWEFPIPVQGSWGDEYVRHFCPLPKEMVATMLEISSDKDDLILDPFAGSGAVIFQAAIMDRKYLGFELNSQYITMFNEYKQKSYLKQKREYELLTKHSSQNEFQDQILKLRALKYGRLLINYLEKKTQLTLLVYIEILEYIYETNKQIKVLYKLLGQNVESLQTPVLSEAISKPPFSKFGIEPIFELQNEINYNEFQNCFCYTKSNSYAFSPLNISSPKIKVVSNISVNLDEKDYE